MTTRKGLCATTAIACALWACAARAQTSPAAPAPAPAPATSTLEEVVVTAQRRESRVQDVPAPITAYDAKALARLGIANTEDLVRDTPGLTFTPIGPGEANIGIRGLQTALGLSSTVAVYVNDTPFDFRTDLRDGSPSLELFDLDRVEVLRGPQGTLFGSSSLGGTIRYITHQPDFRGLDYDVEGGLSGNQNGGVGYSAKGMINIPLSDKAALRVVGTYEKDGGYIDRYAATQAGINSTQSANTLVTHDANTVQIYSLRATARLDLQPELKVTPSFIYQRLSADGQLTSQTNLPLYGNADFIGGEPSATDLAVANLVIEKTLPFATFTSSTSYLYKRASSTDDYSYLSSSLLGTFEPIAALNPTTAKTVVQELRLASPSDQRLRWVTGFYYSHTDQALGEVFKGQGFADLVGAIAGMPGSSNGATAYDFRQKTNDQQIAGFAEVNYDLTRHLELVGGMRVYKLTNGLSNTCIDSGGGGVLCGANVPNVSGSITDYSPRVTLNYKLSRDMLFYATASKGFRPGGANTPAPSGLSCALTGLVQPLFKPDTVWNYEIGAKTQSRNHRYSLNATVYRIDQDGVQTAITDPVCGAIFYANAGSARIYGAELEANGRPLDILTLGGQLAYDSASFVKVPPVFGADAGYAVGNPLPETPRLKVSLFGELHIPNVYRDWAGYLRTNFSYTDRTPYSSSTRVSSGLYRPEYTITDFQIGLEKERYNINFYLKNAFDGKGLLSINTNPLETNPAAFSSRIYLAPRTFGVTVNVKG